MLETLVFVAKLLALEDSAGGAQKADLIDVDEADVSEPDR